MYAVIESGGKQYRVAPGDVIRVERLDVPAGESVELDRILLVGDQEGASRIGNPLLSGMSVTAKVRAHGRGAKIRVFKLKRRKNYRRRAGHRQGYTELEITRVAGVGAPAAALANAQVEPAATPEAWQAVENGLLGAPGAGRTRIKHP